MSESSPAASGRSLVENGPFKGWWTWSRGSDPFETLIGPFHYRLDEAGLPISAMLPRPEHCNGGGFLHGGLLMSFVDFSLFAIAHHALLETHAVTLTCSTEFLAAGKSGVPLMGQGQITRETGSMIFIQGRLAQEDRPIIAFSGILKKIRAKPI